MKTSLRMKCPNCGHWNRIPVDKIFAEMPSTEPKIHVFIPLYKPLQLFKCEKCGKILADPMNLIRITSQKG